MKTPLAWFNTFQNPWRTVAAASGISLAIVLMFMQLGFLSGVKKNAALLYEFFDFDLLMTSKGYIALKRTLDLNLYRMIQARHLPGVLAATGVWVRRGRWQNRNTNDKPSCLVIGLDSHAAPFIHPELGPRLATIRQSHTAWVDRLTQATYGPRGVGDTAIVNRTPLTITGEYDFGPGLLADGSIIVNPATFSQLFRRRDNRVHLGLIKVAPGHRVDAVLSTLRSALPADVNLLTKADIIRREQRFYTMVKPVGIMFQVGVVVAFVTGAVILYQVLATEISNRLNEFATLKAIGHHNGYIYKVGVQQGLIFSCLGYVPALVLSVYLYRLVRALAKLPMLMDVQRVVFVFGLSLAMCGLAAILALRRVKQADPAELF